MLAPNIINDRFLLWNKKYGAPYGNNYESNLFKYYLKNKIRWWQKNSSIPVDNMKLGTYNVKKWGGEVGMQKKKTKKKGKKKGKKK